MKYRAAGIIYRAARFSAVRSRARANVAVPIFASPESIHVAASIGSIIADDRGRSHPSDNPRHSLSLSLSIFFIGTYLPSSPARGLASSARPGLGDRF